MMSPDFNRGPWWFIAFILLTNLASEAVSSCTDGSYVHEDRRCCLCAPGQYLVEHCTADLTYGKCKLCEHGTYTSHANDQTSCDACTVCSHPNGNLEVDTPCTPGTDAKCRCKPDHYCVSNIDKCRLCHPCKKCGDEGIKVRCTGNNDTVCNTKGENNVGATVGIVIGVIAVIACGGFVAVMFYLKKKKRQMPPAPSINDEGRRLLRDVDLEPYLPDIGDILGWRIMQDVAIRSNIQSTIIDNCKDNYPRDAQQQTLELLRIWVQREGMGAAEHLVEILENTGKKSQAQRVYCLVAAKRSLHA